MKRMKRVYTEFKQRVLVSTDFHQSRSLTCHCTGQLVTKLQLVVALLTCRNNIHLFLNIKDMKSHKYITNDTHTLNLCPEVFTSTHLN
jgi:hypothetical protein